MENELPGVLDGVDEPVSVDELEAVVRRAGQRRRARLVAGAAALFAFGALGGAVARGPVTEHPAGFAAPQSDPVAPKPAGATIEMVKDGMGRGAVLTSLFRREANGVAIRVYRATWPEAPRPANPACTPPDMIRGELSNQAAVGFAFGHELGGDAFALLAAGKFGQEEGEPVTWAIVRPGAGVATVRFRLGAGADAMPPQNGIAMLAVPGSTGDGVVEGLAADGSVVATQPLNALGKLVIDPACMPEPCVKGGVGAEQSMAPAVADPKVREELAKTQAELPKPGSPEYTDQVEQIGGALAEIDAKLGRSGGGHECARSGLPTPPPAAVPEPAPGAGVVPAAGDLVPATAARATTSTAAPPAPPPTPVASTTSTLGPNQAP
jgi:hypothetical protein